MTTLGLDLGPTSLGWALVDQTSKQLIDAGVRVFPEGVDNFDTSKELSRGEDRRVARGMRRQIFRRKKRKQILRQALQIAGLLPTDNSAMQAILSLDPYALRRRALTEKLTLGEIGRILFHLNQRRGFLSNRKGDKADKEVKGMLAEISELAVQIGDSTLGSHLAGLRADPHMRVRGKHTRRAMIRDEFDRIWSAQAKHYPELLTDALRFGNVGLQKQPSTPRRLPKSGNWLTEYGIEGIIFFQRLMYWPTSMVGPCELEKGERRCPRADRAAQRFRMLQEVNNLRYIDPDRNIESPLNAEQRSLLLEKLAASDKLDFDRIRKSLGFLETIRFNLETGERSKLDGNKTDYLIAKAVGKSWHDRPAGEKDHIVRLLIDPKIDDASLAALLVRDFGFDVGRATDVAQVDLPAGYAAVSLKAIKKLLPHLEAGMRYMAESDPTQSALHAAGYCRPDELKKRLFDKLPSLEFIRSGPLADIANPVVKRALYEVRKVVNAILRKYEKPDEIHVEMARSMKMSQKKRQEYNSNIRKKEDERSAAADYLREKSVRLSRDAIIRYQLWQQQAGKCIYSGTPIGFGQLFGGDVDVDHILPYSRTLDDSQGNKVVCLRSANHEKGQRSPHEWLADADPKEYEEMCQRARALDYRKYRKFLQKELDLNDFISRQLNDTAYIARLAVMYLKMLVENDHDVIGLKGQYTAELRHQWGLDTILQQLPDSPAWTDESRALTGEKNRADHRHHAIDAIVVALTSRSRLQHLSRIRKDGGTRPTGEQLPEPWGNFRQSIVDKVKSINVSRRVERKVSGKLHEETVYGPTKDMRGNVVAGQFVVRKPVQALSLNEVELIRDLAVRMAVQAALVDLGLKTGRGKKGAEKDLDAAGKMKAALANLKMPGPNGPPIRKVRLLRKEKTIRPIRIEQATAADDPTRIAYVKPGSTHHLCIFEWHERGERVRDAVFVTMLEAARRARDRQPIIQRVHPLRADAKFVMSLSAGEMVLLEWKGETKLVTFRTAVSTEQKQMRFCEHTDARESKNYTMYRCNINTFLGRKVTVDPLGRIRWAND